MPKKLLIALLFLAGAAARAEVKVAHPDKTDDKVRIPSPMVLEMPLPSADPARWNKGEQRPKDLQDLKNYVCDTVTFRDAAINPKKLRSGEIESTFRFLPYTEPGVDKLVTLRVEIVSDAHSPFDHDRHAQPLRRPQGPRHQACLPGSSTSFHNS